MGLDGDTSGTSSPIGWVQSALVLNDATGRRLQYKTSLYEAAS